MEGRIEYEDPAHPGQIKSTPFRSETERARKAAMLQDRYPYVELHFREAGQEGDPPVLKPGVSITGPADTLIAMVRVVAVIGPALYLVAVGIGLAQLGLARDQWLMLALPHAGWALVLGLLGFVFAGILDLLQRIESHLREAPTQ